MPIDFLAIGHMTHDTAPEGFRLGGTVSYAAITARRLGWHPAILTRGAMNGLLPVPARQGAENAAAPAGSILEGVAIHVLPSRVSTTFTNVYHDGRRTQFITARAGSIRPTELPAAWADVPVVLLGPLDREITPAWVDRFPHALMGVTPQGWMRQWDAEGRISPAAWQNKARFLSRADVVIISREDVGGDEATISRLAARTRLLLVTDGWRGAMLFRGGQSQHVPPRVTSEVDPTGAGDVFAAAFLIRLAETRDALLAAGFASIVASLSVEATGADGIPTRQQADALLAARGEQ